MRKIISLAVLLLSISCSSARKEEPPVARVYDKYLYAADLEGVVPEAIKGPDSVQIIRSYIDNWVRQAVILHKAEENIAVKEMDFEKLVRDYKNSLLVYYYEQALVDQRLDTVISEEALRAYYQENKQNFLLAEDIFQVAYAELGGNAPDLLEIKGKILHPSPETITELTKYCLLHASSFSFTDTTWYSFNELSAFLPMDSIGPGNVAPERVFEIKSKNTVFLIAFRELRKKDSVSPYSMQRQSIRHLILNQRRLDLLSDMEKKVFDEAMQNNEFEIYNNE